MGMAQVDDIEANAPESATPETQPIIVGSRADETRTVEVILSSTEPATMRGHQCVGMVEQILSHEDGAITFRAQNNGPNSQEIPLQDDHFGKRIGTVGDLRLEGDFLIGTARLSDEGRSGEIVDMLEKGIGNGFSIGYNVLATEYDRESNTELVTNWQLNELSVVSIPADQNAYARSQNGGDDKMQYRNFNLKETIMSDKIKTKATDTSATQETKSVNAAEATPETPTIETKAIKETPMSETETRANDILRADAVNKEIALRRANFDKVKEIIQARSQAFKNIEGIDTFTKKLMQEAETRAMKGDNYDSTEFDTRILEFLARDSASGITMHDTKDEIRSQVAGMQDLRAFEKDTDRMRSYRTTGADGDFRVSIESALGALNGNDFCKSVHTDIKNEFVVKSGFTDGINAPGIHIPNEVFARHRAHQRAQTQGTASGGGSVVTNEIAYGEYVEQLFATVPFAQMGARFRGGLTSEYTIPRVLGKRTVTFIGETEKIVSSDVTFDAIKLTPHRVGAEAQLSWQISMMGGANFDSVNMDNLVGSFDEKMDEVLLLGNPAVDSDQPTGLLTANARAAFNVAEAEGNQITRSKLTEMRRKILEANIPVGNLSILMTPGIEDNLRSTPITTGDSRAIIEDLGLAGLPPGATSSVLGRPVYTSNLLPTDGGSANDEHTMIVGALNNFYIAEFGPSRILTTDNLTMADQATDRYILQSFIDCALVRANAVSVLRNAKV